MVMVSDMLLRVFRAIGQFCLRPCKMRWVSNDFLLNVYCFGYSMSTAMQLAIEALSGPETPVRALNFPKEVIADKETIQSLLAWCRLSFGIVELYVSRVE